MGRRPTIPPDAKAVSAKLPQSLQIGLQQLILEKWKRTGTKPSQNELFVDAVRRYLTEEGVDLAQIEASSEKWKPKRNRRAVVTRFPKR
jgi:hypothetical protein